MGKALKKIGLIGLGHAGRQMMRIVAEDDRLEIGRCWDPRHDAVEAAMSDYPDLWVVPDAETVVRHADVVVIAAPPATHLAALELALAADRPTLCESPLAIDTEAALAFVRRAEAAQLPAAVLFRAPLARPLATCVEAIQHRGRFGKLLMVNVELTLPVWPPEDRKDAVWLLKRGEGGMTRELISEMLLTVRRVCGPFTVESTRIGYPPDVRFAEIGLEARLAAGGTPVSIQAEIAGKAPPMTQITFSGDKEGLRFVGPHRLRRLRAGSWHDVDFGEADPSAQARKALSDALAALAERRVPSTLVPLREALEVQAVIETLLGHPVPDLADPGPAAG